MKIEKRRKYPAINGYADGVVWVYEEQSSNESGTVLSWRWLAGH